MSTGIPFIGEIFSQLQGAADTRILAEILDGEITGVTGNELLELVRKARTFIASRGLQKGERCGLLAANSISWVAMDLALMAEGRSNAGIARRLWVTEGTVEKHVRSILTKLDLPETDDDHRRVRAVVTFLDSR